MSRPNVTDEMIRQLSFARACVLDQRASSHARGDHQWDEKYQGALDALAAIERAHKKSSRRGSK